MSTYQDLNTSFNATDADTCVELSDLEVIKKNLMRLFTTAKGDVPFNRSYGTSLQTLLFENSITSSDIVMFLYMDITTYEPRVELNPADIIITQVDSNTYSVDVTFTVPTLSNVTASTSTTITNR